MKTTIFTIVCTLVALLTSSTITNAGGIFEAGGSGVQMPTMPAFTSAGGLGAGDCGSRAGSGCGFYFGTEYLLWQTTGMKLPPLVTSNPLGTPLAEAGVIGIPSTQLLLGNETIFDEARSGIRFNSGFKLSDRVWVEGDYFALADEEASYHYDAGGSAILGRPFINLSPASGPIRYDTQLFDYPPANVDGSLSIAAFSQFSGFGTRLRFDVLCNACGGCASGCDGGCDGGCDAACAPSPAVCSTFSMTLGYAHLNLDEGLGIYEVLVNPSDRFDVYDSFETDSQFDGIELGAMYGCCYKTVSFNSFGRIGLGVNQNNVRIDGRTFTDGVLETAPGGVLAQTSNIGSQDENVAAMMAQFGFNVGFRLSNHIEANVGYSGLYWSNVARAGEQIDLRLHDGLFPAPTAPAGTIGAQPTYRTSDFFAHGLNVGVAFVY